MSQSRYTNIFDVITEDQAEAADLKFRADLMLLLRELCEAKGWKQDEIGKVLGIPQSRVSELMTGKVHKCSSDKLIGYLAKLGYQFHPEFKPQKNKPSIRCSVTQKPDAQAVV